MLSDLINKPEVRNFCLFIKNNKLNQKAKMCGVDVASPDYLNFKIYTELLDIPSKKINQEFLGKEIAKDFLYWSNFWDPTRSSGLAFGIKIDTKGVYRKYFHVKFKKDFDKILFENQFFFLKLLKIDVFKALKGISYEILSKDIYFQKFYIYVTNLDEIQRILSYKKMLFKLDPKKIQELELYATETSFKINIINKIDNFNTTQDVYQTIPTQSLPLIKECATILDCEPIYTGKTSLDVTSAYFSFTNKPNNILTL